MDIQHYLIDPTNVNWSSTLATWRWLLPAEFTVWLMNRFGDLFLELDDGAVCLLDVGNGTIDRVADSRDDFLDALKRDDNASQWLMLPLVDQLVATGKTLKQGTCYGYEQLPVLGGPYTVENTTVLPIEAHYEFNGALHEQIKDAPDGTTIEIRWNDKNRD